MKKMCMSTEQYEREVEMFPHRLVAFHDKLMSEGLYDPDSRNFPKEIIDLDEKLKDLHMEIKLCNWRCTNCAIVCAGARNLCEINFRQRRLRSSVVATEKVMRMKLEELKKKKERK